MIILDPRLLVSREPFSTLFTIRQETIDAIVEAMRKKGFDTSQPIHVWRNGNIILDGHVRVKAAIETGMEVTVFYHDFATEEEAMDYALAMQKNRRNLSDAELVRCISAVYRKKSAEATAAKIGTGRSKVQKVRAILSDPEETEHVLSGKKSIREAARSVVNKNEKPKDVIGGPMEDSYPQIYDLIVRIDSLIDQAKAIRREATNLRYLLATPIKTGGPS